MYELHLGDCLEIMGQLEANSIDTCITDPPYGLKFMGKDWDHGVPGIPFWTQAYRLLKPGAFLLAFGGTRTFHRLTCAIEDSGFEIRDCMVWLYGSGWPKPHNISKAIDKEAGKEKIIGSKPDRWTGQGGVYNLSSDRPQDLAKVTVPNTDNAKLWNGWGTALKPAWEPIIVAMKPKNGTFAQNALKYGVAGLNIDGVRKPRWPANVILDEKAAKMLDESVGITKSGYMKAGTKRSNTARYAGPMPEQTGEETYGDSGGVSRFFYCNRATSGEKNEGLEGIANKHPTVKPLSLMRYLCKLTRTPTGGTVLDPFMGSGSTGIACILEDRDFIGIDNDPESFEVAEQRIKYHSEKPIARGLFD